MYTVLLTISRSAMAAASLGSGRALAQCHLHPTGYVCQHLGSLTLSASLGAGVDFSIGSHFFSYITEVPTYGVPWGVVVLPIHFLVYISIAF